MQVLQEQDSFAEIYTCSAGRQTASVTGGEKVAHGVGRQTQP